MRREIPPSLFGIHWTDRKRGGDGMYGWFNGATNPLVFISREGAQEYITTRRLDVEQDCEIVEWRLSNGQG